MPFVTPSFTRGQTSGVNFAVTPHSLGSKPCFIQSGSLQNIHRFTVLEHIHFHLDLFDEMVGLLVFKLFCNTFAQKHLLSMFVL